MLKNILNGASYIYPDADNADESQKHQAPKMAMVALRQDEEVEINSDVLETIISHVPVVDLVSTSRVSKWWRRAVSSSLRHCNPQKPWLILHTQATRFPHATTSHAYDPRSNVWIKIRRPSINYISALKSSHSNFLYMLSPSSFSFSSDPLNSDWCTVNPPLVWRSDPIVARVGDAVVVAGGACYFEDDPLVVEMYDLQTRSWCTCESMPESLKDSAALLWLSVATTKEKLIVTDKKSGLTHWFDTVTKSWSDSIYLNPSQPVCGYHIGCSKYGLILVGVSRTDDSRRVRIWQVSEEDFSCEEIGEMPEDLVNKLKSSCENSSIDIRVAGNIVYMNNTWETEEVVACELMEGRGCRWWSVTNMVAREGVIAAVMVPSCSRVGIGELQRAMVTMNWGFQVVV